MIQRRGLAWLVALLITAAGEGVAYAQYDPWAEAPPPQDPDGMVPAGISLTALGGAAAATGVVLWRTSNEEVCGLSGCFDQPRPRSRIAGMSLFTGGLATGVSGGIIWLSGATAEPRSRQSDALVVTGSTMVSVGVGAATAGITALAAQSGDLQREQDTSTAGPAAAVLISSGLASIGIGIPLWVVGAQDWSKGEPKPLRRERPKRPPRNPSMSTAGLVLAGLSVPFFIGSAVVAAQPTSGDEMFGGLAQGVGAAALGVGGLAFLGVGIPLWAVGASPRPRYDGDDDDDDDAARAVVPAVSVGLGNLELTWTY